MMFGSDRALRRELRARSRSKDSNLGQSATTAGDYFFFSGIDSFSSAFGVTLSVAVSLEVSSR